VFFAHVRAASNGLDRDEEAKAHISSENCHPFKYERYTLVHNGAISQFSKIKRPLINRLPQKIYNNIMGSTDSEHIFALYLSLLPNTEHQLSIDVLCETMNHTISILLEMLSDADILEPTSLNLVLSDGVNVIATRYRSGPSQPPSLYYNFGSGFACVGKKIRSSYCCGASRSEPTEILIACSPLSHLGADELCADISDDNVVDIYGHWVLIPKDYMLVCEGDSKDLSKVNTVRLKAIEVSEDAAFALRGIRSNSEYNIDNANHTFATVADINKTRQHPIAMPLAAIDSERRNEAVIHRVEGPSQGRIVVGVDTVMAFFVGMLTMMIAIVLSKAITV
jgi:predicted glutamine amidotransferase